MGSGLFLYSGVPESARGGCGWEVTGAGEAQGNGRLARLPTDNTRGTPATQISAAWHRHLSEP